MHRPAREKIKAPLPVPDKLFYKIGEVSKITGVEPYVLRYWETEFSFLRPRKNKSGQRVYVKRDLDLLLQVKRMLYQERYTIEGVRKRFEQGIINAGDTPAVTDKEQKQHQTPSEVVGFIKKRLREILEKLS